MLKSLHDNHIQPWAAKYPPPDSYDSALAALFESITRGEHDTVANSPPISDEARNFVHYVFALLYPNISI